MTEEGGTGGHAGSREDTEPLQMRLFDPEGMIGRDRLCTA
jgi:hypothetical protein